MGERRHQRSGYHREKSTTEEVRRLVNRPSVERFEERLGVASAETFVRARGERPKGRTGLFQAGGSSRDPTAGQGAPLLPRRLGTDDPASEQSVDRWNACLMPSVQMDRLDATDRAIIAHLRVGSRNIVGGIVFLATAVAALVLGV